MLLQVQRQLPGRDQSRHCSAGGSDGSARCRRLEPPLREERTSYIRALRHIGHLLCALAASVRRTAHGRLQTHWTKDTFTTNPIVNNTGRDPSTAWQTPAGEWRLTTFDTMIMGSMDFKTWYRIGKQPGFPVGECPSFFPLPRTTPGAGPPPAGTPTPTHVHKASIGGKDWMQVGRYTAGPPRSNGNWTALLEQVMIDAGHYCLFVGTKTTAWINGVDQRRASCFCHAAVGKSRLRALLTSRIRSHCGQMRLRTSLTQSRDGASTGGGRPCPPPRRRRSRVR